MTTTDVAARPGWDRRRLLYGDWSWLVRDALDVLRYAFIAGTIVFAIQGRSTAVALTAASAVLLVARIADLPRWFELGLIVSMSLIAWGTALGLYGHWAHYDKVVHGISPIGYTPVLYMALVRLGVVPDPSEAIRERKVARISGIFITTLAVGMAVGAGYENVEWLEDKWNILGGHFVKGLWDTETDLLCDTGGSLVGATFVTVWALRGWTSRRVTVVPAPFPQMAPGERLLRRATPAQSAGQHVLNALPVVAQGAVATAAGILLLALPDPTLRTVGIVFGVALVAYAAFGVFDLFRHGTRAERGARLAEVAGSAAAGTLILSWPTISQLALLYAAGAASVLLAIAEATSLSSPSESAREHWLGGLSSVALFVVGVATLGNPHRSFTALITVLGVSLLILGVLRLSRAALRRQTSS